MSLLWYPSLRQVQDCAQSNQLDSLRDTNAGDENQVIFSLLIHLGQKCSSYDRKDRPEMEQVLQQFKENPNEAVRRLSQGTLMPPSQPGSPSPFDLQRWYDIRQGQATKPTFPDTRHSFVQPHRPTQLQRAPRCHPRFHLVLYCLRRLLLPLWKRKLTRMPSPAQQSSESSASDGAGNAVATSAAAQLQGPMVITHDLIGGELQMPNLDDLDFSNLSLLDDDDEDFNSQYTGIESKSETDV
ncbi:hypothetical protein MTO96_027170 [Rhipicephalus appendiculatus]